MKAKQAILYVLLLWHGINDAVVVGLTSAVGANVKADFMSDEASIGILIATAVAKSLEKSLAQWIADLRAHIARLA